MGQRYRRMEDQNPGPGLARKKGLVKRGEVELLDKMFFENV